MCNTQTGLKKMSTIYDLSKEQQELLDALFWDDEDEVSLHRLEIIRGTVEQKLQFLSTLYAEQKANADLAIETLKIATKRLKAQSDRAEKARDRLKGFILNTMLTFEVKQVKGEVCNLSHYYPAASLKLLDTLDIANLPDSCKEIIETVKINNAEIKRRLSEGEEIEGAYLIKTASLRMS